jgi:hypothetical protein
MKRLATGLWLVGRPSCQIICWDTDVSFAEVSWFVEGPWYHENPNLDLIEKGMTPEQFQATTCKPGQVGFVCTSLPPMLKEGKPDGYNERAARVVLAYCFLNNLGCFTTSINYPAADDILQKVDAAVNLTNGAVFRPYWENTEWFSGLPEGVLMSGYVHPAQAKAVLTLLNSTNDSVTLNWKLDGQRLLGRELKSVTNLETGAALPLAGGACGPLTVPRHGLVLLQVE